MASTSAEILPTTLDAQTAVRALMNKMAESMRQGLSKRRPWSEALDRSGSGFSKPESMSEAAVRLRKNYGYFRVNYMVVVSSILALSLLSHPLPLILLVGLISSWMLLYLFRPSDRPVVLLGRTYSDHETLGILIVATVLVLFLTSVGSVVISALMVGVALVCAHGAFRVPEDLFLDHQHPSAASGFFSFLGVAPSLAVPV